MNSDTPEEGSEPRRSRYRKVTWKYQKPRVEPDEVSENTSGTSGALPLEIKNSGWNWGAFLLMPFWMLNHNMIFSGVVVLILWLLQVYLLWASIGFYLLLSSILLIYSLLIAGSGNSIAWRHRRFESVDHFMRVQRAWLDWSIGITVLIAAMACIVLGFVAVSSNTSQFDRH